MFRALRSVILCGVHKACAYVVHKTEQVPRGSRHFHGALIAFGIKLADVSELFRRHSGTILELFFLFLRPLFHLLLLDSLGFCRH